MSPSSDSAHRIASLDMLRGVAAFAVAITHFLLLRSIAVPISETVAVLAVEIFFVLSGFVLAPQILFCVKSGEPRNVAIFLIRRWMRTIPPYLFALIAITVVAGPVKLADFLRYALYLQNFVRQENNVDYFPIAWSLSIEEWFYVLFLVFVFLDARFARRRDRGFCLFMAIAFIVLITVIRSIAGSSANWGYEVRRVVLFRIDSIAYGFLLYIATGWLDRRVTSWLARIAGGLISFALISVIAFQATLAIGMHENHLLESLFPFLAAAFGMSAVSLFYSIGPLFARCRILATTSIFMGRISYSTYLFHLVIAMILVPELARFPLALQLGCYLVAIVGWTYVFYVYYERPILSCRPSYASQRASYTVSPT